MSLFHSITFPVPETFGAPEPPPVTPRLRYRDGVFAALDTDPSDLADEAYAAFDEYRLTPGVAERHVARILSAGKASCLPVETAPDFAYEVGRERTDIGRMRVFASILVRMQFRHEMNQRELHILRARGVGRVRVLSGCCDVCDALVGKRYRINAAPHLPVRGCLRHGGCTCAFVPAAN